MRREPLDAERMIDPELGEDPPAPRLRSQREVPRIATVHRDAKGDREIALVGRRIERDEVSAVRIGDQPPDLLQQLGLCEELRAQRARGWIERRHQKEPAARMARDHPR